MVVEDYSEGLQYLKSEISRTELTCRTDDKFLLRFLRAKKCDSKRAFTLLQNYYFVRRRYSHVFSNFVPSSVRDILQSGVFEVLSQCDQLGRKIFVGRVSRWEVYKHNVIDLLRANLMILETLLEEVEVQQNGIVIIYDCRGFTWRHAIQFTPRVIYLITKLLESTFPVRYKEMHIVYMHALAKNVVSFIKPLMTKKMKKRVHLHDNCMQQLHSFLSKNCLPEEYGGELKNQDFRIFLEKVLNLEEEFGYHQKYWTEN
ncbi:alpha-tocopherol transfer protein-like isoform X4 [Centruroides sculpturatus]|uniref:alpha-tocopherol transfer protein-like isoform X1 n=1 Tax=Centruroides sculpturatus TaxID=218467 RepID=UPI000C6C916B|nr:alpha-tocopherol transfer protein-like isoform X1 [Centruroides sculpturatus]XP_023228194.1 alpha-tocopherol transfer protein-like isoform X3 [Centruroides sculpturatus]XP_023228195.1 alpha-tocopherol transfer protein-like isoform X4 [Centruroides sculpturatus]